MKTFKDLLESSTEGKKFIINDIEAACTFFNISRDNPEDSKKLEFITLLFDQAPVREDGSIISPLVGAYTSKSNFALRRWVANNPQIEEYIKSNKIDLNTVFSGEQKHEFRDYHDTKLGDIDKFPNSSEEEYLIALSMNIKSLGKKNVQKALKYALFGDTDIKLESKGNEKKLEIFEKYLNYYKNNSHLIDKRAENCPAEKGELFTKCQSNKKDIQDTWKKNGQYEKNPNSTPKTDLISNKGRRLSCKKSTGAQAMSGGLNETMATLMNYSNLLDEESYQRLQQLFYEDGKKIDWSGKNRERNKNLNTIIKEIFGKPGNEKFVIAVITEAITGAGKFGKDSDSTATAVLTWSKDGKVIIEDPQTYIYSLYKHYKGDLGKLITINHKSSGSSYACARMNIPSHNERYEELTEDEKNDDVYKIISIVRDNKNNPIQTKPEDYKKALKDKLGDDYEKWEKETYDKLEKNGILNDEALQNAIKAKCKEEDISRETIQKVANEREKPKKNDEDYGDEEVEDDDKIEDDGVEVKDDDGKTLTNPAKEWKRRKLKNGEGTTKSYYNKNGDSISEDEYKKRKQHYIDKLNKAKSKNESRKKIMHLSDFLIENKAINHN